MKKRWIAIILNIFLPGVGFIYLRKPALIIGGVVYILYTFGMIDMALQGKEDFISPLILTQVVVILLTYEITKDKISEKQRDRKKETFKKEEYLLCKKCGKKNLIDSIYCEFCGAKIKD